MASPIKVGIIGLSAGAKTAWASSAHLPYLLSPRGRQRYQVVALCNSSVDAAKRAIAHFNLDPATTRAYGDPADLARDPDVDLVVTNTRVDKHLETTIAAAQAGKDLFIEWPLAGSREDAAMLAGAVKKRGQKTVVGLQGRVSPPADKIREILAAGKVGRVLSSEFRASGGLSRRDVVPVGLQYFTERKIGGNPLIIGFMHREYSRVPP